MVDVSASAPMVTQDSPVLESSDRVLDARTSVPMPSPSVVAHDLVAAEARRDELGDSSVPTIGQHASMLSCVALDVGAAVVEWIVAISRATGSRRYNNEVPVADQQLRVA